MLNKPEKYEKNNFFKDNKTHYKEDIFISGFTPFHVLDTKQCNESINDNNYNLDNSLMCENFTYDIELEKYKKIKHRRRNGIQINSINYNDEEKRIINSPVNKIKIEEIVKNNIENLLNNINDILEICNDNDVDIELTQQNYKLQSILLKFYTEIINIYPSIQKK